MRALRWASRPWEERARGTFSLGWMPGCGRSGSQLAAMSGAKQKMRSWSVNETVTWNPKDSSHFEGRPNSERHPLYCCLPTPTSGVKRAYERIGRVAPCALVVASSRSSRNATSVPIAPLRSTCLKFWDYFEGVGHKPRRRLLDLNIVSTLEDAIGILTSGRQPEPRFGLEELRNMTIRFVRSFPFGRVAARCGRATVARAQLPP